MRTRTGRSSLFGKARLDKARRPNKTARWVIRRAAISVGFLTLIQVGNLRACASIDSMRERRLHELV